ncbi:Trn-SR family protein [Megaselia abdita]
MENAPPLEIVNQAIFTLHSNSNTKDKNEASKWLDDLQKSIYSWKIADELLQQKRDLYTCFFAAQTLRNKIENSFQELPVSSHQSLRDSLLAHVGGITADTDTIIVTQLCLALVDLALLLSSWKDPVPMILENLSKDESILTLLEIFILFPEEIDSRFLRLGSNRRKEINEHLKANGPQISEFLKFCMNSYGANPRYMNKILKCFNSWVRYSLVSPEFIGTSPLTQQVFSLLNSPDTTRELHDTAADCMCTLLTTFLLENIVHNQNPPQQGITEMDIFNGILALENAYHTSVAHEDTDKVSNYCRIFTVLGETYVEKMISSEMTPHYSIKALDLVLVCVGHFDYDIAEITFNLWYQLSDELYTKNSDQLNSFFKPYIERLIGALYRHAKMESDHTGLIDETESFYDFRQKVSQLIKDVAFIVGSGSIFKQMFLILQEPSTTWESTESALFVMQNVAKNILPEENEVIPKVVEAILNLPENTHIAVRYTSIMLLGELCDWIDSHPQSLQAVLNFLLFSLQQKNGLAPAAAISLTHICSANREQMTYHITGLIEISRSLDNFEISNELAIGLLKGFSLILSKVQAPQLQPVLREICSFQFLPLARIVEEVSVEAVQKGERNDPSYWIDRACAIIRHTNPNIRSTDIHPSVQILTDAWPLLSQVLEKYQTDVRIIERTCRLIRYGLRMVGKQASHLLEPLVKQMVLLYNQHRHSCFLYLGSILVDEFARLDDCINGLLEMLKAFIEPTFNMLQMDNGLKNNPNTVDDFFRLCSRFIECLPIAFLQSPLVTPIFQCALLSCSLDHTDAHTSVMKFFCNLLKCGKPNYRYPEIRDIVRGIIAQNGDALVVNLIHASIFYLHSYMLPDVADVLYELKLVDKDNMEKYLCTALDALPKKNSGGYVTATQQQLTAFKGSMLRADAVKAATIALKDFTRLYR